MKTWECRCVLQWCFKAPFPQETATMCFSAGTSGVTCVTTNLPGSHDAIQMLYLETHTSLFVCATYGFGHFFFFFCQVAINTYTDAHRLTPIHQRRHKHIMFCIFKCIDSNTPVLTNHPLMQ